MKTMILLVALCCSAGIASAASLPNQPRTPFIVVDYAPARPPLTKATLWVYLRWLRLY